jgi:hypothetical protein
MFEEWAIIISFEKESLIIPIRIESAFFDHNLCSRRIEQSGEKFYIGK